MPLFCLLLLLSILNIIWHQQNPTLKKDIIIYDSAKKLLELLTSYEIISTLSTENEKFQHYACSEIVQDYITKYN